MKKLKLAILALAVSSGSAFAATAYTPAEGAAKQVTVVTSAANYTYTVPAEQTERLFVKNNFDFTLSSNVIIQTQEETAAGRYMGVATTNVKGRNFFTGHSDGGSVTTCGDPLTATDAKDVTKFASTMATRFVPANDGACQAVATPDT